MDVDESMKKDILEATAPIIASATTAALVAAVGALIDSLLAINMTTSTMAGDKGIHPTEDNVSARKSEVATSEAAGKLSQDKVSARNGDLAASKTDAAAQNGEATALESGAAAARTKGGAADIETKALKMT